VSPVPGRRNALDRETPSRRTWRQPGTLLCVWRELGAQARGSRLSVLAHTNNHTIGSLRAAWAQTCSRSATLPRLGSRVRIPSPAPDLLKEIRCLKWPSKAISCFPAPSSKTGEGSWLSSLRAGRECANHTDASLSRQRDLDTARGTTSRSIARPSARYRFC
jgi:hypothetical protein